MNRICAREKVGKKVSKNNKFNHDEFDNSLSREEMMEYELEVWSRLPIWVREMLTMMDKGQ